MCIVQRRVKVFYAEEISAMFFVKMKETFEAYFDMPMKNAVITLPSYFNDFLRKATTNSVAISGLKILRIINASTAAAIAYSLDKKRQGKNNVIIFDLGGGTLNVSLLTNENCIFEVKATAEHTKLGGEDFDNILVEYCGHDFFKKK